jgi:hypothetical protein
MPSKTILFTNNGPAITTLSFLQLPNDGPTHFKQLPVQNDDSALTIFVLMTITATGLQAYDDRNPSLNDVTAPQAFFATTAPMTTTMTQVPTIITAITKVTLLKLDKCFLHSTKTSANNATIKSESHLLHS